MKWNEKKKNKGKETSSFVVGLSGRTVGGGGGCSGGEEHLPHRVPRYSAAYRYARAEKPTTIITDGITTIIITVDVVIARGRAESVGGGGQLYTKTRRTTGNQWRGGGGGERGREGVRGRLKKETLGAPVPRNKELAR